MSMPYYYIHILLLLLLLLSLFFLSCSAQSVVEVGSTTNNENTPTTPTTEEIDVVEYGPPPSSMKFRVGILHAVPFAIINEHNVDNGGVIGGSYSIEYSGFTPDLLRAMVTIAKEQDGVELTIQMEPSIIQQYNPDFDNPDFDYIANDCNKTITTSTSTSSSSSSTSTSTTTGTTSTTTTPLTKEQCNLFDIMAANYYATSARSVRASLTPPILRSTISTVKYSNKKKSPGSRDYTTLLEAETNNATVCLKEGTFYATLVKERYPRGTYLMCPTTDECLKALKNEQCVLNADDELQIRYNVAWDDTLEVTREQFNTQYIVWAMKDSIPPIHQRYFKKWMWDANTLSVNDELYSKYFQKALCPVGTAGDNCELYCDPNYGKADSRGICVCVSTKYTGSDCSIEVPEDYHLIPKSLKIVAYCMLCMNVIAIGSCGTWLYLQRTTPQVRVSQPSFLLLVLLGCLISSCTILVLAQEDGIIDGDDGDGDGSGVGTPPKYSCMAIPWLYSVGFSVTFGTLFAKIRRVYKLFRDAANNRDGYITGRRGVSGHAAYTTPSSAGGGRNSSGGHSGSGSGRNVLNNNYFDNSGSGSGGSGGDGSGASSSNYKRSKSYISVQETLFVICGALVIDVILLVVWTIVDPLQWKRTVTSADQFGVALESEGRCISEHWTTFTTIIAVFHVCLMGVACILCYVARDIPTKFSEGKYVSIAMISNLQIFIVGVPILIIIGTDPVTSFFVRSVVIWMNGTYML